MTNRWWKSLKRISQHTWWPSMWCDPKNVTICMRKQSKLSVFAALVLFEFESSLRIVRGPLHANSRDGMWKVPQFHRGFLYQLCRANRQMFEQIICFTNFLSLFSNKIKYLQASVTRLCRADWKGKLFFLYSNLIVLYNVMKERKWKQWP